MTPQRYQLVKRVFLDVCRCEPAARAAVLDQACGQDHTLRTEVESLLAYENESDFLDGPLVERNRLELFDLEPSHACFEFTSMQTPSAIAGFRVLDVIGEGGMGVVFRAEQDNPRRAVALKVVRAALASEQVIRRFEQEAQILGRLKHPGIAQIFQAGAADTGFGSQPFFAMELVRGIGLRLYADQHALDVSQRLELVAKVCDAVQHAHQHGVIHRDLKPGNILVDEFGQPKILDFGVGRIVDSNQADDLRTLPGQIMGTLSYMSPEQVEGRVDDVDTLTDVYSLGVLLYELLSGQLPHDLSNRSIAQCVSAIKNGAVLPLGRHRRSLKGDVETIVAKAMHQDKSQRYATSSDLAADIRRFLARRPILARRQTAAYTLHRFYLRNRLAVTIAILLGIATILIALQTARQIGANRTAAENAQLYIGQLQENLNVNEGDFLTPKVTTAKLQEFARFAREKLSNQPLIAATLLNLIGLNYMLADEFDEADRFLRLSLNLRQSTSGASAAEIAQSLFSMGRLKCHQSQLQSAEEYLHQALDLQNDALGPSHKDIASTLHGLASALRDQTRFDEALDLAHAALQMRLQLLPPDDDEVLASYNNIASIHEAMGDDADAAERYEQVLALIETKFGPDTPRVARTKRRLASCHIALRQFDTAELLLAQALGTQIRHLGPKHSDVAATHFQLGRLALARAQVDTTIRPELLSEARQHCMAALDIQQRRLEPEHPETRKTRLLLDEIESMTSSTDESQP